jgi:hypothetical protein
MEFIVTLDPFMELLKLAAACPSALSSLESPTTSKIGELLRRYGIKSAIDA